MTSSYPTTLEKSYSESLLPRYKCYQVRLYTGDFVNSERGIYTDDLSRLNTPITSRLLPLACTLGCQQPEKRIDLRVS